MAGKIIFNGRVYRSVAEMPPDERKSYESLIEFCADKNLDGVPDLFQQGKMGGIKQAFEFAKEMSKVSQRGSAWSQDSLLAIRITDSKIFVNGRAFNSVDEMPSEVRQAYEQTIDSVDPGSVDIYEEPWREVKRDTYFTPHEDAMFSSQPADPSFSDVTEMIDTNTSLVIVIAAICVLCAAVTLWLVISGTLPGFG